MGDSKYIVNKFLKLFRELQLDDFCVYNMQQKRKMLDYFKEICNNFTLNGRWLKQGQMYTAIPQWDIPSLSYAILQFNIFFSLTFFTR